MVYPVSEHDFIQFFDFTQPDPATPLFILGCWLAFYALTSICRKPDPLYFEKTFQQDFSVEREKLNLEHEKYLAKETRATYTNSLSVDQCVQKHSEMRVQYKRLGLEKKHMYKTFHDMPIGDSNMGRAYSYDILVNPLYCNKFNYIETWQIGRLSFIAQPNCNEKFEREAKKN
jgi:hypothetical protein